MNLLLDTHVVLWAATAPEELSAEVRAVLEDATHEAWVSAVSAWELAVKQSLGKLELAGPAEAWLPDVLARTGFRPAPVTLEAALAVRGLPWLHRDPFDRLLVAQAASSGMTLVTRDAQLARYGVPVLVA